MESFSRTRSLRSATTTPTATITCLILLEPYVNFYPRTLKHMVDFFFHSTPPNIYFLPSQLELFWGAEGACVSVCVCVCVCEGCVSMAVLSEATLTHCGEWWEGGGCEIMLAEPPLVFTDCSSLLCGGFGCLFGAQTEKGGRFVKDLPGCKPALCWLWREILNL